MTAERALGAGVLGLGGLLVLVLLVQDSVDVGSLVRDPQTTTESPWHLGVLSTAGVAGWAVGAAMSTAGAAVCAALGAPRRTVVRFGTAAALTAMLCLDDALLLHDDLFLRVVDAQEVLLAAYGLALLVWLAAFRRDLAEGDPGLLAMAVGALGTSVLVDVAFAGTDADWRLALEDGAKLTGIWLWALHVLSSCLTQVRRMCELHDEPRAVPAP